MSIVLMCGQNTHMSKPLYFVLQRVVQHEVSNMWCESIQEKLQSCVCRHYEEKIKSKNKTAIGPESVDDETDPDQEDK
jgi:hypothetical protein